MCVLNIVCGQEWLCGSTREDNSKFCCFLWPKEQRRAELPLAKAEIRNMSSAVDPIFELYFS